jgi:hypothetical protein
MKNCLYNFKIAVIYIFISLPVIASAQDSAQVTNPLESDNIGQFLEDVLDTITTLSVPVIALMIIYAGFMFVTAGGDEGQIEDAKKTALYTAIGAAIILGAELIVTVLENTAESFGVGGLG